LSATVVASDATTADAYATWMMVIGVERARTFLESRADIDGLLVYDRDGEMVSYQTENLKTL
jgi:thiamine biosynthesis lipoprotein